MKHIIEGVATAKTKGTRPDEHARYLAPSKKKVKYGRLNARSEAAKKMQMGY